MKRRMILIGIILLCIIILPAAKLHALVAADFEGAWPTYGAGGTSGAVVTKSNSILDAHNGSRSLHINYKFSTPPTPSWFWFPATFSGAQDWQNTTILRFWLKGDGSTNKMRIQFVASGNNYAHPNTEKISLQDTTWRLVEIPLGTFLPGAPSQAHLSSVTGLIISVNGNDTNANYNVFIDDLEVVNTYPQVHSFDNVNTEIYTIFNATLFLTNSTSVFQEGTGWNGLTLGD